MRIGISIRAGLATIAFLACLTQPIYAGVTMSALSAVACVSVNCLPIAC